MALPASNSNEARLRRFLSKIRSIKVVEIDTILAIENHNGFILDRFIFDATRFPSSVDVDIFIVRFPIEDNYFTRSSHSDYIKHNWSSKKIRIIATTFELSDICNQSGMPLEKALSRAIAVSYISNLHSLRGGEYFDLFTENAERSPFNYCGNKNDIKFSFLSGDIGERARSQLTKINFSKSEISTIDRDMDLTRIRWLNRIELEGRNRPVLVSAISILLGAAIGFLLSSLL